MLSNYRIQPEKILNERTLENGFSHSKVSVPLGVIAIIYESRPTVTSDAATLMHQKVEILVF